MGRDLKAELEMEDGNLPPSWTPSEGDSLIGTLLGMREVVSKYGPATVAIVEDASTEMLRAVYLKTALRTLWAEECPEIGDRVGIKRLPTLPGKAWHRFTLKVERAAENSTGFPFCQASGLDDPFNA
jgi:hypothetical protein